MFIAVIIICVFIAFVFYVDNRKKDDSQENNGIKDRRMQGVKSNPANGNKQLFMVFDTETGGLNAEENDILQLSYQIVDRNTLKVVKEVNQFFPWPADKSRIQMGAIKVNGLTESYLARKVLSNRKDAITRFFQDMGNCSFIVAHNGEFDKKFINATASREHVLYVANQWPLMIDTMKTTIDLCRIPQRSGKSGYKWPKLIELAECLRIKTDDINLHDSSSDVELTKRCFIFLLKNKFYNL